MALWDNAVLPPAARKKRADDYPEESRNESGGASTMSFTVVTKRGNKQNVRFQFCGGWPGFTKLNRPVKLLSLQDLL